MCQVNRDVLLCVLSCVDSFILWVHLWTLPAQSATGGDELKTGDEDEYLLYLWNVSQHNAEGVWFLRLHE